MGRRQGARVAVTILASLVAGGLVGAGIGAGLYGPAVGVSLAALIGIGTGVVVRRQILRIRRARSGEGG